MMKTHGSIIASFLLLVAMVTCVEPIDPASVGTSDLLVVEGIVTDQPERQEVLLSRTNTIRSSEILRETGATVWMVDGSGLTIDFEEVEDGRYLTVNPYAAGVGQTLQLFITTSQNREYKSEVVEVQTTPPIDSVYAEFTPEPTQNIFAGRFQFFVDSRENPERKRYFRWKWNTTFELSVPWPSRWILRDGEFINRDRGGANDSIQVEICWSTFISPDLVIQDLEIPELGVRKLPLLSFHSDNRQMIRGYNIQVKQYALEEESFNYWNQIQEITEDQGSLSDKQPGTIVGNLTSITDPAEIVLGYFEAAQEQSVRRQYVPLDFLDVGYRAIEGNFVNCVVDSVVSAKTPQAVGATLEDLGDEWALAYFSDGPPFAVFYPKSCSECTQYGVNKRPDFWE